jgi:hypothetical protein
MTAAEAGWAGTTAIPTGSWVRAAGAYIDRTPLPEPSEPALASGVGAAPARGADVDRDRLSIRDLADAGEAADDRDDDLDPTPWTELDEAARRAAMARHPAFRNQHPDPAPPTAATPPAAAVDELLGRLGRGAERATDEAQLRSLAVRAFDRLVDAGSVTWLAPGTDGGVATWATTLTGLPDGACHLPHAAACPALSTGSVEISDRSDELDACPHLVDDDRPACAATCIPVAGDSVLLVRTPPGSPCSPDMVPVLVRAAEVLASRASVLRGR